MNVVMGAVHQAPDGAWIAGSEKRVREVSGQLLSPPPFSTAKKSGHALRLRVRIG